MINLTFKDLINYLREKPIKCIYLKDYFLEKTKHFNNILALIKYIQNIYFAKKYLYNIEWLNSREDSILIGAIFKCNKYDNRD